MQPLGPLREDPDYGGHFPGTFLRCRRARVLRRVAAAVVLSEHEQRERERRYKVWEHADEPVWDEHGVINPSRQMRENGVTREWTRMLRPWLGPDDVGSAGRLLIALRAAGETAGEEEPWNTILDVVPALDRDCRIRVERRPEHDRSYWCRSCGTRLQGRDHAAVHQLGERAVDLLLAIHGWNDPQVRPAVLGLLVRAAIRRDQSRWTWLREASRG
ncbi:hypothetical protein [Amycolatopsis rubida]|uniref:Uncharacterized protein n=1 Tax=Amycolatopsis rubida TaxID=112413 RepID=A0A1I6BM96_9PSEU|nr:hypothetical protein [Amycolatopsis rubida]SFQ82014.1 hypothetical protein SAMN05421854_13216 [Amycolatopsis rubida]